MALLLLRGFSFYRASAHQYIGMQRCMINTKRVLT